MPKKKKPTRTTTRRPRVETTPPQSNGPESALTIVGVGASAGGLEAFSQLLEAVPADAGLALVLVQHLAPDHDSALPILLSTHTKMPVVQVSDGIRIEADHVYVIPPNMQMELDGSALTLMPRPTDRTQHLSIDTFFASLARFADGQSIAVILSGTASDGAIGIRDVKAAGGITIAQKPESAKYESMPRAAIATGMVDLVLTPSEIGKELARIASHPYVRRPSAARDDAAVRDVQLYKIFELLRPVSGVDFRHYKRPTIRRRLQRRMALHRLTDVDAYIALLQSRPAELRELFQDLLIHVTRFFREPESFAALVEEVWPRIVEGRNPEHPIRVWVCGCATGEEAYSVAIALVEFLGKAHSELRVQIFATDVSSTAIEHARAGVYSAAIAEDVGPERLRRFFTKTDGHYRVNKVIRDMCVFASQDLTKDPPFSRLDLVMCRNVLIYMDTVLQNKLIALFHYALNANGFLVLGEAETVGAQANLFSLVDKKYRIHRKKGSPRALPMVAFPVDYHSAPARKRLEAEVHAGESGVQREVSRIILDRFAPAGVVVDNDMQVVQFRGQTGAFLEPAPGDASFNLLKMVREGLLHGLRTALHQARKSRGPVRHDGLQVRSARGWTPAALEVIPLTALQRPHFLVLFEQPAAKRGATAAKPVPVKAVRGQRRSSEGSKAVLLQRELAASREYLQSIIQELEAANEELQSANEEILSSNEELQSTNEELDTAKEELQSTNEELNTVNEELHGRNEEMSRINSDLMNLVGSVQIAIVIVSPDLRIRRFTPMAEKVLNLIPSDVDRSIGHINPNIDCPDLERLIRECMETVSPIERDVQDRQGKWFSLRIRPYKSLDNKIDGAVVALFDVDSLKRSEQRIATALDLCGAVLKATPQPIALIGEDLHVQQANAGFAALFGATADELRGRGLDEMAGRAPAVERWRAPVAGTPLPPIRVANGKVVISGEVIAAPDSSGVTILATARGGA